MPTLIYYDASGHQAAQQQAADMADRLTDLVRQFAALALPNAAPIATADLPALLEDPQAWLVARFLGGGGFSLGGLPVNAAKVMELVEWPAGFDAFVQAAQEAGRWLVAQGISYELRHAESYAVGAGGQVALSNAAAQAQEARFKRRTATAAQDALLADLTAVCTVLNRLRTGVLAGGALLSEGGMLNRALVVPMHGSADEVRPNPDFILTYAR
jgi:hypothetical protein